MLVWRSYLGLNDYLRQFPQSHDKHMTQTVSNMASTISFGIKIQGKNFDQVTYSTKLHSTKWPFDENFRRSVVRQSVVDLENATKCLISYNNIEL